jgi:hypothetical protein
MTGEELMETRTRTKLCDYPCCPSTALLFGMCDEHFDSAREEAYLDLDARLFTLTRSS